MKNNFGFICVSHLHVRFAVTRLAKVKKTSDAISGIEDGGILLYDYHVAKVYGNNLPYSENYKKALYISTTPFSNTD